MKDVSKYLGIPYKKGGRDRGGVDCWGLVRLFYDQEYGVLLPAYIDHGGRREEYIRKGIEELAAEAVTDPQEGDLVVISVGGRPSHVGVWLDGGKVLHILRGCESVVEDAKRLRVGKVYGIYRI